MLSRGLARALPLVAVQTKQALPRVNYTMCKRTTATEAIHLPTTAYQTLAFYEPPRAPNPAEAAVRTMADGKLVSDQLVATMLESYLRTSACEGWVLDGFPRNATQAKMLFSNMGTTPDLVVELVVSHDDIRERLQYRRVDPVTGAVYNLAGERPSDTAVLQRLEKRTDDCAEVIERRLRVYEEAMPAIRQVFQSHGVAIAQVVAEGGASVEDVARAVSKVAQGKRIVLAGAPGCGKGTQGVLLAEAIGGKHVSTGDLLRKAARLASEGLASGVEQKDVRGAVLRL